MLQDAGLTLTTRERFSLAKERSDMARLKDKQAALNATLSQAHEMAQAHRDNYVEPAARQKMGATLRRASLEVGSEMLLDGTKSADTPVNASTLQRNAALADAELQPLKQMLSSGRKNSSCALPDTTEMVVEALQLHSERQQEASFLREHRIRARVQAAVTEPERHAWADVMTEIAQRTLATNRIGIDGQPVPAGPLPPDGAYTLKLAHTNTIDDIACLQEAALLRRSALGTPGRPAAGQSTGPLGVDSPFAPSENGTDPARASGRRSSAPRHSIHELPTSEFKISSKVGVARKLRERMHVERETRELQRAAAQSLVYPPMPGHIHMLLPEAALYAAAPGAQSPSLRASAAEAADTGGGSGEGGDGETRVPAKSVHALTFEDPFASPPRAGGCCRSSTGPKRRLCSATRDAVSDFVMSNMFSHFIVLMILVNTGLLAMDSYPPMQDDGWLEFGNNLLALVFAIEMVLKLFGLGLSRYAGDTFNLFDGFVVLVSGAEFCMTQITGNDSGSAMSVLRTFRMLRVFKLARSWTGLRDTINTVTKTLGQSGNFALLLLLCMYIFALVGMQLFARGMNYDTATSRQVEWEPLKFPDSHRYDDPTRPYETAVSNFDDFLNAMTTVFQVLTGEDWNAVMFDGIRSAGWVAAVYFCGLVMIGKYIVLNLFLAMLLGNNDPDGGITGQLLAEEEPEQQGIGALWKKAKLLVSVVVAPAVAAASKIDQLSEQAGQHVAKQSSQLFDTHKEAEGEGPDQSTDEPAAPPGITFATVQETRKAEHSRSQFETFTARHQKDALHGYALYVFGPRNQMRVAVSRVVLTRHFENAVMLAIIASSVCLALDDPNSDPDSHLNGVLASMNFVFTLMFTAEMVLRVLTSGFRRYIRVGWNQLDFIVVSISLLLLVEGGDGSGHAPESLKSLKALRALRPLRMIRRIKGMKAVVDTMVATIPHAANVMVIVLLFFLVFGIIATNFFKGEFHTCSGLNETQQETLGVEFGVTAATFVKHFTRSDCLQWGGAWVNAQMHFDNVGSAISTIFQMSTTEGWVTVMNAGVDATGTDTLPVRDWQRGYIGFFMLVIIVCSFFSVNLFVGAVIDSYYEQKTEITADSDFYMTPTQREWVDTQLMIAKAKLKVQNKVPANRFRRRLFHIVHSARFEAVVIAAILVNTGALAATSYDMPASRADFLEWVNRVCCVCFTMETIMKIIALDKMYFMLAPPKAEAVAAARRIDMGIETSEGWQLPRPNWWNLFDLIVVLASDAAIVLNLVSDVDMGSYSSLARTLRLLVIIRVMKTAGGLTQLITTVVANLPALGNITAVLMILIFVYTVMGMQVRPPPTHSRHPHCIIHTNR
jgi:hypothetical protein